MRGASLGVYVLRRIFLMIPTLFIVSVLCFVVIQLQPGSFTDRYLEDPRMSPATVARLEQQLGLTAPLGNSTAVGFGGWSQGVTLVFFFCQPSGCWSHWRTNHLDGDNYGHDHGSVVVASGTTRHSHRP